MLLNRIESEVDLGNVNYTILKIRASHERYSFFIHANGILLGTTQTRYLSSEVAGGCRGVLIGLYAYGEGSMAEVSNFKCDYL
ncbi:hypothetical protein [Bacillus sp. NSP9.1]|uniref:beta-xylosidase family glycoside hydrolase n=1 Tax=Bacillus sp. NSP9.1 TaxID=1071078 RepID=UPI001267E2E9|nr:hypothetical protein [Bacillus sp. NSP9.1]